MSELPLPEDRTENYFFKLATGSYAEAPEPPESRIDKYLVYLIEHGGGGGTGNYNDLTGKPEINGITLSGNKSAEQLGLKTSDDLLHQMFIADYGNITLLDSPYSEWQTFVNDMAIALQTELFHIYAPYSSTMIVEVFIDIDDEYPIKFNWSGKLFGKNASGIKEIGVSPKNVVMRDDLADDVLQILDVGIIDAGNM